MLYWGDLKGVNEIINETDRNEPFHVYRYLKLYWTQHTWFSYMELGKPSRSIKNWPEGKNFA